MPSDPHKVMLVEPDADTVEVLVAALSHRLDAQVTCVPTAEACLDIEMINPHHLIVADMDLPDSPGLQLVEHLKALSNRPIILMAADPSRDDVLDAMRLGVRDVLIKPFAVADLLDTIERSLHGYSIRREHFRKYSRMRDLVRKVIRERRELNRRVDLICRDLVGAHRRLVHRVLDGEKASV